MVRPPSVGMVRARVSCLMASSCAGPLGRPLDSAWMSTLVREGEAVEGLELRLLGTFEVVAGGPRGAPTAADRAGRRGRLSARAGSRRGRGARGAGVRAPAAGGAVGPAHARPLPLGTAGRGVARLPAGRRPPRGGARARAQR